MGKSSMAKHIFIYLSHAASQRARGSGQGLGLGLGIPQWVFVAKQMWTRSMGK